MAGLIGASGVSLSTLGSGQWINPGEAIPRSARLAGQAPAQW
jgi:hypothetical protein